MIFDNLSPTQQWTLVQLTHGDFVRSRYGWSRPESIKVVQLGTLTALQRRGLCTLDVRRGKVRITAGGRRLLKEECAAVNAAIARSETGPAETRNLRK